MTTVPASTELPESLCETDQWVCWREQSRGESGKPTKVPINPMSGRYASATDSETWTSFEVARAYAQDGPVDGLGFVFDGDDPFVGVDLDDARNPRTDEIEDWAEEIIEKLDSYTEVSPSGTGYHVIIEGELPSGRNRRGDVECYEAARFFTMTGEHVESTPQTVRDRRAELFEVYQTYVADEDQTSEDAHRSEHESALSTSFTLSDKELLERARSAENSEKFERLWRGNTQGYDSHSEADMALACMLAFWTSGDTQQMDRLFRQSELMREKWDDVHYSDGTTYGERTLSRAARVTTERYAPQHGKETETAEFKRNDVRNDSASTAIDPPTPVESNTTLQERERARIETITSLNQRLRQLESENERLRAERDALQSAEQATSEDGSDSTKTGLLSRLRQLF